jgi:hypothetical protein
LGFWGPPTVLVVKVSVTFKGLAVQGPPVLFTVILNMTEKASPFRMVDAKVLVIVMLGGPMVGWGGGGVVHWRHKRHPELAPKLPPESLPRKGMTCPVMGLYMDLPQVVPVTWLPEPLNPPPV